MNKKYILDFSESDYEFIRKKYISVDLEPDKLEGQLLAGRYEVIRKIQEKKNTIIYEVHCLLTDKMFIAEVHRTKYEISDADYMILSAEMEQLSKLSHENVLSVFDFGNDNGIMFSIKEYFGNHTLEDYLIDNPRPFLEQAILLSKQIISGMDYAEKRIFENKVSLANLDICPENIFVSDCGKIKINFQWSYNSIDEYENYHYMSPEAARGIAYNYSSNLYSLGCVLYRLFTGRTPYIGDGMTKLAIEHIQTIPESPLKVNELIPKSISDVIERCMKKDSLERYASCEGILNDCSLLRED